jgi:hypothetical protein
VSGIFLPLRVNSLPLATIYEVKIPLRKWKKSLLQRNPAQMTWANVSNLFHDLKNVKIAEKSLKIGQFYPILPTFTPNLNHVFEKSW